MLTPASDHERDATPEILFVDDDTDIRTLVTDLLKGAGFSVQGVADGAQMRSHIAGGRVDLVVLDLNLQREDGLGLCRELRAVSDIPIIMLTARADSIDRVLGLELGADDYITKPFEPRELLARVRNLLRRSGAAQRPVAPTQTSRALFDGWTLDLDHRHLMSPDGTLVMLSGVEYALLRAMVDNAQEVLSREKLLNACNSKDISGRAVDLQICRLRQKIGDEARASPLIKTVRGEGYVFAARVTFK